MSFPANPSEAWRKLSVLSSRQITRLYNTKIGKGNPSYQDKIVALLHRYGAPSDFPDCVCGRPLRFVRFSTGFGASCGESECVKKVRSTKIARARLAFSEERKEQVREKLRKAWTAEKRQAHASNLKAVMLERYGVEHHNKIAAHANKISRTKRGYSKEKLRAINSKREQTCLQRYGVTHTSQDPEVFDRILQRCHQLKTVDIQGVTYKCRGYEPDAIRYLLEVKGMDRVRSIKMPAIRYTLDGREHRYYPDLFAKKGERKMLIEVKSVYTLGLNSPSWWKSNRAKFKAAYRWTKGRFYLMVKERQSWIVIQRPHEFSRLEMIEHLQQRCSLGIRVS